MSGQVAESCSFSIASFLHRASFEGAECEGSHGRIQGCRSGGVRPASGAAADKAVADWENWLDEIDPAVVDAGEWFSWSSDVGAELPSLRPVEQPRLRVLAAPFSRVPMPQLRWDFPRVIPAGSTSGWARVRAFRSVGVGDLTSCLGVQDLGEVVLRCTKFEPSRWGGEIVSRHDR